MHVQETENARVAGQSKHKGKSFWKEAETWGESYSDQELGWAVVTVMSSTVLNMMSFSSQ